MRWESNLLCGMFLVTSLIDNRLLSLVNNPSEYAYPKENN